ncbi:alpha/beta hydrolase [Cellulosimicrobium cellulans]|jgi:pimeloyl-ACP methyl ester carboxylesterase|uniref:Alpha/beta hydrolase n=1 Tax=Cellulosimicrobium cellulans TaxID=1710 RepID=A0A1Y0HTG3_CELCE|nr:alpha/beta hydrolase [Cellulosimicrobium cellulans]ARU50595.1 alpha/beta hydrolase [Cellulosimicrobium cellulans]
MNTSQQFVVHHLARAEGRLAYTDEGTGPLLVASPGMGDLRATYDDVAPHLVAAGYRVVVMDLRGHGDSDTTFSTHGDEATASDYVALVEHLDAGPAVLLGSSMAASAAVIAAAERPDLVRGLVLLDGFLREPSSPAKLRAMRVLYRLALARPWGAAFWASFYGSLNKGRTPARLADHQAAIRAHLSEPGRLRSFRDLTLQLDHRVVEPRVAHVEAPALAIFGALDPDYADPAAEAAWAQESLGATTLVLPEVGHYPQLQAPEEVVAATLAFLAGLPDDAARPAGARREGSEGTRG